MYETEREMREMNESLNNTMMIMINAIWFDVVRRWARCDLRCCGQVDLTVFAIDLEMPENVMEHK